MKERPADPLGSTEVALLIGGGEGYGVSRILRESGVELRRRGWTLHIFSSGPGRLADQFRDMCFPVEIFSEDRPPTLDGGVGAKSLALARLAHNQLRRRRWLAERLYELCPRLLIVSNPLDVLLAGAVGRRLSLKRVWLIPNSVAVNYPLDVNRRLYDLAIRRFGVLPLANSRHTLRTLGRSMKHGAVVHLGVGPEWSKPLPPSDLVRSAIGASVSDAVYGIFARLTESKGQAIFLEALRRARPGLAGCRVLLCGGPLDSSFAESIRSWASQWGISDRVHLEGPVEDVRPYYAACDVVVNSRVDAEPFGLTVIEAMHSGLPVLAHRLGGPEEIIRDGETGWLVDASDPASFEASIHRMLGDRPRWRAMGEQARVEARQRFTTARMMDDVLRLAGVPPAP